MLRIKSVSAMVTDLTIVKLKLIKVNKYFNIFFVCVYIFNLFLKRIFGGVSFYAITVTHASPLFNRSALLNKI